MIGLFRLTGDHQRDILGLDTVSVTFYYEGGTPAFDYDEATATFVAGSTYDDAAIDVTCMDMADYSAVAAELKTDEMLLNKSIIPFFTILDIFMKTGISAGSISIRKYFDMFTDAPSESDTINMYNDAYEINSGVSVARVNGTRSSIIHNHIPVRMGEGKGVSIDITATDEAEIHDIQFALSEASQEGGV